jgi:hypothetical protein
MTPATEIRIVPDISTPAARTFRTRIFVRRGALWRFHRLWQAITNLPVAVEWDRRSASAPIPGRDRRGKPTFTWEQADFVVVEDYLPTQRGVGSRNTS